MPVRFSVLASGSRGNASLIAPDGFPGVLIDIGLGPKTLADRLTAVGTPFGRIACVLLTHTHADHVDKLTLRKLASRGITLHCHEGHIAALQAREGFDKLERKSLIKPYLDRPFLAKSGARVEPIELRHDGGPTYGFRIETRSGRYERSVAIGYVADTGTWRPEIADALANVDAVGLEFNHDVELQKRSGRPAVLIARNLGDKGHLSNDQGAELLAAILQRSVRGTVRNAVLLHLSSDCNDPKLAIQAARRVVREARRRVAIHAASQDPINPEILVYAGPRPVSTARSSSGRRPVRPRRSDGESTLSLPFDSISA
jgi:phosphoribosyl 1,2-cyclic phosphodiesterase